MFFEMFFFVSSCVRCTMEAVSDKMFFFVFPVGVMERSGRKRGKMGDGR